ncbi:hypothetical protein LINPERPRIM_LOCUS38481 [Linum perenne]
MNTLMSWNEMCLMLLHKIVGVLLQKDFSHPKILGPHQFPFCKSKRIG